MSENNSQTLLIDDSRFVRFKDESGISKYIVLVRCSYYLDANTLDCRQWEALSMGDGTSKKYLLNMNEIYPAATAFAGAKQRQANLVGFHADLPMTQKVSGLECPVHKNIEEPHQLAYKILAGAENIEDYDAYAMLGNHMVLRTQTSKGNPTSRGIYASDDLEEDLEKQIKKGHSVELEFCKINLESFVLRKRKRFMLETNSSYVITLGERKGKTLYLLSIIKGKVYSTEHESRALRFLNEDSALDFSFKLSDANYNGDYSIDEMVGIVNIPVTFKDDSKEFNTSEIMESEVEEFLPKHMKI